MFFLHRIFRALLAISAKEDTIIRKQDISTVRINHKLNELNAKVDKLQETLDKLQPPPTPMATKLEIVPDT